MTITFPRSVLALLLWLWAPMAHAQTTPLTSAELTPPSPADTQAEQVSGELVLTALAPLPAVESAPAVTLQRVSLSRPRRRTAQAFGATLGGLAAAYLTAGLTAGVAFSLCGQDDYLGCLGVAALVGIPVFAIAYPGYASGIAHRIGARRGVDAHRGRMFGWGLGGVLVGAALMTACAGPPALCAIGVSLGLLMPGVFTLIGFVRTAEAGDLEAEREGWRWEPVLAPTPGGATISLRGRI